MSSSSSSGSGSTSLTLAKQIIQSHGKLWFKEKLLVIESEIIEGLTNSSFLINANDKKSQYILRIENINTEKLGIHRKFEYLAHQYASNMGIAPSIIHRGQFKSDHYTVRKFISGEIKTELSNQDVKSLATTIAKLHSIELPAQECVFLSIKDRADNLWKSIPKTSDLVELEHSFTQLLADNRDQASVGICHFDLIKDNIIFNNNSAYIIDWEYAAISDQYFDLATIISSFNFDYSQLVLFEEYYCREIGIPKLSTTRLILNQLSIKYLEILWLHANNKISRIPLTQQLKKILEEYRQQMLAIQ